MRILLVEDNPGDARLLEWYLSKPGSGSFDVTRAERLSGALRELAASRFDLVLLDLSLPDSSGLDTVRSARRAAGMTPIVVMTMLDDEETALAALRDGAQDYLVKGKFDNRELTRALRYAIERERVDAELAAEAERAKILFEDAPDASTLTDLQGTILDANRAAERLFGYRRGELVGANLLKLDLLPMSEVTKVARLLVDNAFGQATGPDELVLRRRDDTLVAVELYTHVVTIHGRKVVLSSMRDITERKRIERSLHERVTELDCLFGVARLVEKPGTSHDGILQGVADLLARALQRAQVAGARVQFGTKEYRTAEWEETTLRIREPLRVDGLEAGVVELGYLPNVGESGLSFLPEEHSLLFAVATRLGRTLERLHAAAALRESEERFRRAFDDSGVGKLLTGLDGRLLSVNRAFAAMLGYTIEELQSLDFMAVTHPEDVAANRETMIRLQTGTEGSARFEKRYIHKDGSIVWVELSTVLLRDLDGKPQHFVADVVNITERKLAEAEVARKNAELVELNEEKNHLLGMAAHDLRNPLSIVNTASAFLLDDSSRHLPEAKRDEFIRRVNSSSRFMLKLIDDLLDVAKIEAGRLELELREEDLCSLVEDTVSLNRMLADKKRIRLDFAPECGLPTLRFDRGKIEQVLNNLVSNALKFSAPGTAVMVQASRVNGSVVVSVLDQGQGIPFEELDKLFKPFGKTSARSTAGESSTGLGLAICRRIVEGHGGRIWAESKHGKGSIFSFSLPVAGPA